MKVETNKLLVSEFHTTKPKVIDLDYLYSIWSFRCCLCEWRSDNTWEIWIQPHLGRKSVIAWSITNKQAAKIINDLGLHPLNKTFKSAFEWRTKKDWIDLYRFTKERNK